MPSADLRLLPSYLAQATSPDTRVVPAAYTAIQELSVQPGYSHALLEAIASGGNAAPLAGALFCSVLNSAQRSVLSKRSIGDLQDEIPGLLLTLLGLLEKADSSSLLTVLVSCISALVRLCRALRREDWVTEVTEGIVRLARKAAEEYFAHQVGGVDHGTASEACLLPGFPQGSGQAISVYSQPPAPPNSISLGAQNLVAVTLSCVLQLVADGSDLVTTQSGLELARICVSLVKLSADAMLTVGLRSQDEFVSAFTILGYALDGEVLSAEFTQQAMCSAWNVIRTLRDSPALAFRSSVSLCVASFSFVTETLSKAIEIYWNSPETTESCASTLVSLIGVLPHHGDSKGVVTNPQDVENILFAFSRCIFAFQNDRRLGKALRAKIQLDEVRQLMEMCIISQQELGVITTIESAAGGQFGEPTDTFQIDSAEDDNGDADEDWNSGSPRHRGGHGQGSWTSLYGVWTARKQIQMLLSDLCDSEPQVATYVLDNAARLLQMDELHQEVAIGVLSSESGLADDPAYNELARIAIAGILDSSYRGCPPIIGGVWQFVCSQAQSTAQGLWERSQEITALNYLDPASASDQQCLLQTLVPVSCLSLLQSLATQLQNLRSVRFSTIQGLIVADAVSLKANLAENADAAALSETIAVLAKVLICSADVRLRNCAAAELIDVLYKFRGSDDCAPATQGVAEGEGSGEAIYPCDGANFTKSWLLASVATLLSCLLLTSGELYTQMTYLDAIEMCVASLQRNMPRREDLDVLQWPLITMASIVSNTASDAMTEMETPANVSTACEKNVTIFRQAIGILGACLRLWCPNSGPDSSPSPVAAYFCTLCRSIAHIFIPHIIRHGKIVSEARRAALDIGDNDPQALSASNAVLPEDGSVAVLVEFLDHYLDYIGDAGILASTSDGTDFLHAMPDFLDSDNTLITEGLLQIVGTVFSQHSSSIFGNEPSSGLTPAGVSQLRDGMLYTFSVMEALSLPLQADWGSAPAIAAWTLGAALGMLATLPYDKIIRAASVVPDTDFGALAYAIGAVLSLGSTRASSSILRDKLVEMMGDRSVSTFSRTNACTALCQWGFLMQKACAELLGCGSLQLGAGSARDPIVARIVSQVVGEEGTGECEAVCRRLCDTVVQNIEDVSLMVAQCDPGPERDHSFAGLAYLVSLAVSHPDWLEEGLEPLERGIRGLVGSINTWAELGGIRDQDTAANVLWLVQRLQELSETRHTVSLTVGSDLGLAPGVFVIENGSAEFAGLAGPGGPGGPAVSADLPGP